MNKRRALIWYEMRTMRWIILAGVLCVLVYCFCLYVNVMSWDSYVDSSPIDTYGYYWSGSHFSTALLHFLQKSHVIMILLCMLLGTYQFQDMHRKKTEEYLCSLPFTKKERFWTKVLMGYGVIGAVWILISAETLILWNSTIDKFHKISLLWPFFGKLLANETIWHILRILGLLGMELFAIYTLFVLMNLVVHKGVIASLFTVGVLAAPTELHYVIAYLRVTVLGRSETEITYGIDSVRGKFTWLRKLFTGESLGENVYGVLQYVLYDSVWRTYLVFVSVCIVGTVLTWYLSRAEDVTRQGTLVSNIAAKIVLSVGIGLCFGEAAVCFFGYALVLPALSGAVGFVVGSVFCSSLCTWIAWKILSIKIR